MTINVWFIMTINYWYSTESTGITIEEIRSFKTFLGDQQLYYFYQMRFAQKKPRQTRVYDPKSGPNWRVRLNANLFWLKEESAMTIGFSNALLPLCSYWSLSRQAVTFTNTEIYLTLKFVCGSCTLIENALSHLIETATSIRRTKRGSCRHKLEANAQLKILRGVRNKAKLSGLTTMIQSNFKLHYESHRPEDVLAWAVTSDEFSNTWTHSNFTWRVCRTITSQYICIQFIKSVSLYCNDQRWRTTGSPCTDLGYVLHHVKHTAKIYLGWSFGSKYKKNGRSPTTSNKLMTERQENVQYMPLRIEYEQWQKVKTINDQLAVYSRIVDIDW